jgi:hypothetical protein
MPYLDLLGSDMRLHFFSCVVSSFVLVWVMDGCMEIGND